MRVASLGDRLGGEQDASIVLAAGPTLERHD
jgi:hypothetical protein